MKQKNIGKLFSVLVVGGALMAQAGQDTELSPTADEVSCKIEVHQNYDSFGQVETIVTCLDEKSDEEALQVIKEARKNDCASPFCGCWLG